VGITVNPVRRVKTLEEFGSLDDVAQKLLEAEKKKAGAGIACMHPGLQANRPKFGLNVLVATALYCGPAHGEKLNAWSAGGYRVVESVHA
jgi:hypothetical protein